MELYREQASPHRSPQKRYVVWYVVMTTLMLALLTIVASCAPSQRTEQQPTALAVTVAPSIATQPSPVSTASAVSTATALPSPTLYIAPKVLTAEREVTEAAIFATRWAQGTRPVVTPFPSVIATRVYQTPVLGISGECFTGSREYDMGNCWSGVGNGEYVYARSFVFKGYGYDPMQGVLIVHTSTLAMDDYSERQEYNTPMRVGLVDFVEAEWPLLTMRTRDHTPEVTFTFNLSTRLWVSPPITPSPSTSPSPIASPQVSPSP